MDTEIQISDLTESMDGNGTFDKLIGSMKGHLQEEFSKGRITGANYSNVYLGGLTTVMQQSIEFLLRKDTAAAQADLIKAQILNTEADTEYKNKQVELADTQIEIAQKELLLKVEQIRIAQEEVKIKGQELLIAKEQLKKIDAEVRVLNKQEDKLASEIALLDAKKATELGQTNDVSTGLVGAQRALYTAQTLGFTNDHNYKMTKTRADIYSVMLSQDPDALWNNPPPSWVLG